MNIFISSKGSTETREFSNCSNEILDLNEILAKVSELGGEVRPYKTTYIYMPTYEAFLKLTLYIEEQLSPIMSNTFDITSKKKFVARYHITGNMKKNWQDLKNFCKELGGEILDGERVFNFKDTNHIIKFINALSEFI